MGVDFLNRMKRTYSRTLDHRAVALRTASLLDADARCVNRTARGSINNKAKLVEGETVIVRVSQGKLIAQRGNEAVVTLENPPADYADRVRRSGGIAKGEVKTVSPISQTAEVSLCD